MLHPQLTLNCAGRLLSLEQPRIMGILNLTPDSFYAGSRTATVTAALQRAEQMLAEGADLLDLGGMSTRPGADFVDPAEEQQRVVPIVAALAKEFPQAILSVDTVHHTVARAAVAAGASMINDVSAGQFDAQLYATVAELGVPYVLMHLRGTPQTMTRHTHYNDLITDIWDFLATEIGRLRELGVVDIIIDPGFGFAKSVDQNFSLLKQLSVFRTFDLPLLVGLSRKSMIWRTLGTTADQALNGSSVLHLVALQQGARILRVHDVAAAREVITLWQRLEAAE